MPRRRKFGRMAGRDGLANLQLWSRGPVVRVWGGR